MSHSTNTTPQLRAVDPVPTAPATGAALAHKAPPAQTLRTRLARRCRMWRAELRAGMRCERGAVTAEYAIVIMAAVAFAGLLVVIMRSGEVQAMLTQLVQNALGSAG